MLLTGNKIKNSYFSLLTLPYTNGFTGYGAVIGVLPITDGNNTASPLAISEAQIVIAPNSTAAKAYVLANPTTQIFGISSGAGTSLLGVTNTGIFSITGIVNFGTLGYSDTNIFLSAQSSVNTYNQLIIQNSNVGTTASADFIVNNNNSTATTFYGDFGMNSSGFTGSGAFNGANNVYVTATSADLAFGTTTANAIHFVVNSGTTDAMTISSTGAFSINGLVTQTLTGQTSNTVIGGYSAINSTAATAANQQYSPSILWQGNGWKTTATAASQAVSFKSYVVPVQGTTNPSGYLFQTASINGGAYNTDGIFFTSDAKLGFSANGNFTPTGAHYIYNANSNEMYITSFSFIHFMTSGGVEIFRTQTDSVFFYKKASFGITPLNVNTPGTALIQIAAGTASANTAPIQINNGIRETTARTGLIEFENNWYHTTNTLVRFGVGGKIFNSFTDGSSTSTNGTFDTLYTYTTIASTLAVNGDGIRATVGGIFISSATASRDLKVTFGGTLIADTAAITNAGATDWVINVDIIRVSATVVRCIVRITSGLILDLVKYTEVTGLTLSNTNVLLITGAATGTGAASGDIVAKLSKVYIDSAA